MVVGLVTRELDHNTPIVSLVHTSNNSIRLRHHLQDSRADAWTLLTVRTLANNDHCLVDLGAAAVDEMDARVLNRFLDVQFVQVTSRERAT